MVWYCSSLLIPHKMSDMSVTCVCASQQDRYQLGSLVRVLLLVVQYAYQKVFNWYNVLGARRVPNVTMTMTTDFFHLGTIQLRVIHDASTRAMSPLLRHFLGVLATRQGSVTKSEFV